MAGRERRCSAASALARKEGNGRFSTVPERYGRQSRGRCGNRARPDMAYACSTSSFPRITRSDDALRVDFYHLTRTPVESVLPRLLEKVVSGGERALVVAGDAGQIGRAHV